MKKSMYLRMGAIFALSLSLVGTAIATQPMPAPGTYGSSTQVGRFTIDSSGKINAASNVTIALPSSLPPSGPAGGDLSGSYPNPTIGVGMVTADKLATGVIPPSAAIASLQRGVKTLTNNLQDLATIEQFPAGSYVITAKLNAGAEAPTIVECFLNEEIDPGTFAVLETASSDIGTPIPPSSAAGTTLSLLTAVENPTNIHLFCHTASGFGNGLVHEVKLVAIQVGTLTLTP